MMSGAVMLNPFLTLTVCLQSWDTVFFLSPHDCQLTTHSELATKHAPPVPSNNVLPSPVIFIGTRQ